MSEDQRAGTINTESGRKRVTDRNVSVRKSYNLATLTNVVKHALDHIKEERMPKHISSVATNGLIDRYMTEHCGQNNEDFDFAEDGHSVYLDLDRKADLAYVQWVEFLRCAENAGPSTAPKEQEFGRYVQAGDMKELRRYIDELLEKRK
ncbi:hypothetical protein DM02DRAFT_658542 [Periconia macrospinosa]|uniref:Uncharacterized protein n=1 Tax=Periconia macrospinosa TaxID=97972 RepID=A0A2V1DG35_9PLEO|nr:hypothetical protein DM02DRAFT_658542 [Periconia macrospinosa]